MVVFEAIRSPPSAIHHPPSTTHPHPLEFALKASTNNIQVRGWFFVVMLLVGAEKKVKKKKKMSQKKKLTVVYISWASTIFVFLV